MPQLVIIADDLTGAADTGACFAGAGFSTVIPFSGAALPSADVVVLSTESRELNASDAAQAVTDAISRLASGQRFGSGGQSDSNGVLIYKKIDSALRGHPRAELLAVMDAMGATRTVVAPAFPAQGRTTVGGRQHSDGVPLEGSHFRGSGADSDLVALFSTDYGPPVHGLDLSVVRGQPDELRRLLDADSDAIVVADAETDDDLLALSHAASRSRLRLFSGTAGFARQLVRSLPLTPEVALPLEIERQDKPILIIAGSRHEVTERQTVALRAAGVPVVRPAQSLFDDPEEILDATVAVVAAHLAAGRHTALTTVGLTSCPQGGNRVAARLAQVVAASDVRERVGGLVLTGGDIAAAACAELNVSAMWLRGEVAPGLPWGVLAGGPLHARPVATKAGSFGEDDALLACISHLTR